MGPISIREYENHVTKRLRDDKYMGILAIYVNSIFQDFKSFLRTEVDRVKSDIKLLLDEYNSCFITYELTDSTFKDISEAFINIFEPE